MAPRAKEPVAAPAAAAAVTPTDMEDLIRKRDAFVTSMALLRNAADEASRASLAYFDIVTLGAATSADLAALRAFSVAPGHEEDGVKKRKKRNVKPKDPDAPKKPSTPYFLFCSAGRETVKKDLGGTPSFKEVQDELKNRWEATQDKQKWSELYQKLLGDWKVQKTQYDETKAIADGEAMPPPASAPATATPSGGGFTAVNHSKSAKSTPAITESDDEDEAADEPTADEKAPSEEPEEEEPEEEEQATTSDSSLTPPPKEKPKTPRGRKAAAVRATPRAAKAVQAEKVEPVSTTKKRKSRSSKKEEVPEPVVEIEETPKRKKSKRRKSGAAE